MKWNLYKWLKSIKRWRDCSPNERNERIKTWFYYFLIILGLRTFVEIIQIIQMIKLYDMYL